MSWKTLVHFTFENHAAVDESGNGNTGVVSLPAPDRWIDRPDPHVTTAVRYDHPESKIVIPLPIPSRPTFAGWAGFNVRVIFRPAIYNRRINLVEGDGSFALFVEPDGRLKGTINDGKHWYGVETTPGIILPNHWYLAEFLYNPATMMVLRLNQSRMATEITHGDPVLPVGPNGIRIGYWPGGDARYTFLGLIGPVVISTLDPIDELVHRFGKLVCPDTHGGHGRLEELLPIIDKELTDKEKQHSAKFVTSLLDAVRLLAASLVGTSTDPNKTIARLRELSDKVEELLIENEEAGTDLFRDPALKPLLDQAYQLILASPNARDTLLAQVVQLLAARPFGFERIEEILDIYPGLRDCTTGPTTTGFNPGGLGDPLGGLLGEICKLCRAGEDGGDGIGSGYGQTGDGVSTGACGGRRDPCSPSARSDRHCDIHIHVHCDHEAK